MKKVLRFILVLLVVIAAGVLILGLIAPKDIEVTRTVSIDAPKEVVANQMFHYSNFKNWSPWQHLDTNMQTEVVGEDGKSGALYKWHGNKKVGKGEMTASEVTDSVLRYNLKFMEPWENTADGYWRVRDLGQGKSEATWNFKTHLNFPMNGLMMVMGMKKLSKDFEDGLSNLKKYSELHANDMPASNYNIQEIEFPGHNYATVRKTLNIHDDAAMMKFFSDNSKAIGKAAGKRINGYASGIYYNWDEKTGTSDMAVAFPVSGDEPVKGMEMVKVEPSKGYMINFKGGYSAFPQVHGALNQYLASKKLTHSLIIEEYVKGENQEKDSTKWETNVIYLVK